MPGIDGWTAPAERHRGPDVVVVGEYTAWSGAGRVRHPVFLGLRENKAAEEVVRDIADPQAPRTRFGRPARRGSRQRGRAGMAPSRPCAKRQRNCRRSRMVHCIQDPSFTHVRRRKPSFRSPECGSPIPTGNYGRGLLNGRWRNIGRRSAVSHCPAPRRLS